MNLTKEILLNYKNEIGESFIKINPTFMHLNLLRTVDSVVLKYGGYRSPMYRIEVAERNNSSWKYKIKTPLSCISILLWTVDPVVLKYGGYLSPFYKIEVAERNNSPSYISWKFQKMDDDTFYTITYTYTLKLNEADWEEKCFQNYVKHFVSIFEK